MELLRLLAGAFLASALVAGCATPTSPQPTANISGIENITLSVGEFSLPGTLTRPADPTKRKPIVVLLIAGSGPNDQDETIGKAKNKPLRDIAGGLAHAGISTVRFDKRTYVLKTAASSATIQAEYLDDVDAALKQMAELKDLAGYRTFVLGHSQGGMILPNVLKTHPKLVGGIIAAGTPRTLWDVIWDQNVASANKLTDKTAAEKAEILKPVKAELDKARAATDPSGPAILGLASSYVMSLNQLNSGEVAATLTNPLLVIQGGADFQVSATDFAAWRPVLAKAKTTYKLYPGLNHLFMADSGRTDTTAYDDPATVDHQVTNDISDWLLTNQ